MQSWRTRRKPFDDKRRKDLKHSAGYSELDIRKERTAAQSTSNKYNSVRGPETSRLDLNKYFGILYRFSIYVFQFQNRLSQSLQLSQAVRRPYAKKTPSTVFVGYKADWIYRKNCYTIFYIKQLKDRPWRCLLTERRMFKDSERSDKMPVLDIDRQTVMAIFRKESFAPNLVHHTLHTSSVGLDCMTCVESVM